MTRPVSRTSLRTELLINFAVLAVAALVFAVTTVMLIYNEVDPRRGALYIGLLVAADVIVVVAVGAFQIHRLIVRPLHETAQEVLKHVARLWGFGVHLESVDGGGTVTKRWSVPAPH